MKNKKFIIGVNVPYLKEHIEEIANNTDLLLPYFPFSSVLRFSDDAEQRAMFGLLERKHLIESGNWHAYGRGEWYKNPGESSREAEARLGKTYCEATGHWDLFEWEEVPEESLKK